MKEIETLYSAYKDDVFRYLYSLTRDTSLSEDLMQDTFVKAILSIHRFRRDCTVKTWLLSIARKLWMQNLRWKKAHREVSAMLIVPTLTDSVETFLDTQMEQKIIDRVHALLLERDDMTRKVMHMRFEGCSYGEIGQGLGISESSARVIFFRTKGWLKVKLKEEKLLE